MSLVLIWCLSGIAGLAVMWALIGEEETTLAHVLLGLVCGCVTGLFGAGIGLLVSVGWALNKASHLTLWHRKP